MIKYFCDRCGKESKIQLTLPLYIHDGKGNVIEQVGEKDICEDCAKKLAEIKDELVKKHYLQDFMLMSDEDIELFRFKCKVGDKVITANGRTGTITSICDCECCKSRGFYEPEVDFGDYTDYIMISDKKNGFKSYYSIGDRIFGNLDEESVNKEIYECQNRMLQLYYQLGTIQELKIINQHQKDN